MGEIYLEPTIPKEDWKDHQTLQYCYEVLSDLGKTNEVTLSFSKGMYTLDIKSDDCLSIIVRGLTICALLINLKRIENVC